MINNISLYKEIRVPSLEGITDSPPGKINDALGIEVVQEEGTTIISRQNLKSAWNITYWFNLPVAMVG